MDEFFILFFYLDNIRSFLIDTILCLYFLLWKSLFVILHILIIFSSTCIIFPLGTLRSSSHLEHYALYHAHCAHPAQFSFLHTTCTYCSFSRIMQNGVHPSHFLHHIQPAHYYDCTHFAHRAHLSILHNLHISPNLLIPPHIASLARFAHPARAYLLAHPAYFPT